MSIEQKLNYYRALGSVGSACFDVDYLINKWTSEGWTAESIVKGLQQLDMQ